MKTNITKVVLAISVLVLTSLGCGAFSSLLGDGSLLKDDCSDNNSGWGTGTDTDSSVEYSNGGLQTMVFTPNYLTWSTPNATDYDKVHIEVTATHNDTN